ncbi:NADH-quinone oxidoreductase subunit C [Phaeacidiphilus oryzae]|uniref:NADH-quinone oxidoreductase subunit C n=1 Tax=Phaeacidiphilus oryzae TaxID=348818 RepID=UPI000A03FC3C|nr:NADH-quinone oxidoreductase subunit C [Phaeacidiphilus oryzae]
MSTATPIPEQYAAAIGPFATAAESYDLITVDVPAEHWIEALTAARDGLGLGFFDWLSAVDELADGFAVCAHLARVGEEQGPGSVRRLLLRTRLPREAAALPTAVGVYAGAAWHERETHEMFGIDFTGHPYPAPLLLPDGFEGHPLRKEFVLAARVAKAWPGAKEPGESDADHGAGAGTRRKMLPPGVPDPNEWGPLKGTLPPAPARPARGARAAAAERPARRARSASAGSASQRPTDLPWNEPQPTPPPAEGTPGAAGASKGRGELRAQPPTDPQPAADPAPRPEPRPAEGAPEGRGELRAQPSTDPQPAADPAPRPEPRPAEGEPPAEGASGAAGASKGRGERRDQPSTDPQSPADPDPQPRSGQNTTDEDQAGGPAQ